jgi:hypothetical protein
VIVDVFAPEFKSVSPYRGSFFGIIPLPTSANTEVTVTGRRTQLPNYHHDTVVHSRMPAPAPNFAALAS